MKKGSSFRSVVGLLLIIIPLNVLAQKEKLLPQRITPAEFPWSKSMSNQGGSAMRPGLETVIVAGDGKQNGLYSIALVLCSPVSGISVMEACAARRT